MKMYKVLSNIFFMQTYSEQHTFLHVIYNNLFMTIFMCITVLTMFNK